MATIEKIFINNFRNLTNQKITLNTNTNIFIGNNAHGKTNLIEAIYYLGHNKSFKTKNLKDIINTDSKYFQIHAKTNQQIIKIKKTNKEKSIHINQKQIKNSSELTKILPIQIISPDKGFIVGGTPKNKRSYLDWGVFHLDHNSIKLFKQYNKIIKNVNSLLSNNNIKDINFWFLELAKTAIKINKNREKYIDQLKQIKKNSNLNLLNKNQQTTLLFDYYFYSGWPKEVKQLSEDSICSYLLKNIKYFLKIKHLNHGPHKASIVFLFNNKKEETLSRGEQKTLSVIFWLNQVLLLIENEVKPIVLIDDLSSEIDQEKTINIIHYLNNLNTQTFVTNISKISIKNKNISFFNIDNGNILNVD